MMLIVLASVLSLGLCAVPHDKVAKIFSDFDYNSDDNINQNEVIAFFHNLKSSPTDVMITKATFIGKWGPKYGDNTVVSGKMYDHMDMNNDGLLTDGDVPLFYEKIDTNHNGIEWAEFEKVFNEVSNTPETQS